jgi:MFS transporter, FHS family, L-fucose permease
MSQPKRYLVPFILITSLFFFWGFVHNLDPILIPHLRKAFRLSTFQSSLVDSAVFIAYFLMAIPAGLIMKKYGYKGGILIGLIFFATGCFLFVPAANTQEYTFFLGALFIIACGLTILETAANPYAAVLGPEESSAQRLNFAQSFNGLAAMVAPLIGGRLILSEKVVSEAEIASMSAAAKAAYVQAEAASVKMPYIVLGSIIILVALIFYFTRLPEIKEEDGHAPAGGNFFRALRHRHLSWAVAAQFFYIGAQVCVSSFFILVATRAAGISEKVSADYLGLGYGLAFMVGRFVGTFLMRYVLPQRLLAFYSAVSILLSFLVIFGSGMVTVYALIAIAFFMSIMFPTIFALGIRNLGPDTKPGSSLIIMSIVGGAVLPPVLGYLSDVTHSIQYGYVVPLCCFIVVFAFAVNGYKIKEQDEKILLRA